MEKIAKLNIKLDLPIFRDMLLSTVSLFNYDKEKIDIDKFRGGKISKIDLKNEQFIITINNPYIDEYKEYDLDFKENK